MQHPNGLYDGSHAPTGAASGSAHHTTANSRGGGGGGSGASATASPSPRHTTGGQRAVGYTPVRTGEATSKRSAKACLYCRRGKARCDGLDHWPCRRCRDNGIECVFEGVSADELRERMAAKNEPDAELDRLPVPRAVQSADPASLLEVRLARLEGELEKLQTSTRSNSSKIARLEERSESGTATNSNASPQDSARSSGMRSIPAFPQFAKDAFEMFWEMYAPLAPYIVKETDDYDVVRHRSPCLMHCIIAVASRHSPEKDLVDLNRSEALRLMRETLYADKSVTLDDLKALLVFNAWLGRGAPPGHTVTLALQLDLPKCLERLLESITQPPEKAAEMFEELMPATRVWLTLYAQDLWLSFATARRALVTIDLSITSARLLLHFSALRPVDARLIAQSELVTILGVVQESFLKTQRHSVEHTIHIVQQANAHLEQWIATWSAWTKGQEEETGNFVLSSFSIMLQAARFYMNTLGLRDVTSSDELLPIHHPCLRTALDAAVRIQGIHRAHKIAHSAEMTLIVLSSCALFLLKMIKLAPNAFASSPSPSYPPFAALDTSVLGQANAAHLSPADPVQSASSPDTAASPLFVSTPSISQALDAARHSAALLDCGPPDKRSYAQAVHAALRKLQGEMDAPPSTSFAGKRAASGSDPAPKRLRPDDVSQTSTPFWPTTVSPGPSAALETLSAPGGAWTLGQASPFPDLANIDGQGIAVDGLADAGPSNNGVRELDELTIASLIGTDSFWSWTSSLPGESIQPLL
ncbi:hypothetical protein JCM10908_000173 [Rhodotorula pacifica]|uniref:Zn(II)2Cys6 transcription factor n=1 Tax=Rhodotorula pacifica TaxID=1495444 RepID=UPI003171BD44